MISNHSGSLAERCYCYSVEVVKFVNTLPERKAFRIISDQLLRSATSIGANVVEGKGASTRKDFTNYYFIALKSANETAYWMDLLRDGLEVNDTNLEKLRKETGELTRILGASIASLKRTTVKSIQVNS